MSCHFTKTRAREKYTAHKRVTFQMSFSGPRCIDRICDKKAEQFCCPQVDRLIFVAVPSFVGCTIDKVGGGCHYSLVLFRSYYSGNLLVFLLLCCWVCSRKSKRCWITIFVIVQTCNSTPAFLHYLLKTSGLIDSKSLYLDLFSLEVLVSLNKQVR